MDEDVSSVRSGGELVMSLPRRAMSGMGFAVCCLMCDAPDEVGSARCKGCISRHEKVRERLSKGDDGVARWGRELLSMLSMPEKMDHDEIHGELLRGYVNLINQHEGPRTPPSQEEIDALFAAAKARPKGSLIRDMANRNPWKDAPPSARVARAISDDMPEAVEVHAGKRTVPSKEIVEVDRSERVGEDLGLSDRVSANVAVQDVPADLRDVLVDVHIAKREAEREKIKDAIEGVDDLFEDED